ncbi:DUF2523 family protein [Janthinobacterium sp. HLX7-2]|uniref:DUF2523 family protein n=1 Tax=Janthinobacterium sp. HLX7-2 TaxID=1259331 RepID=UPI003F219D95
MFGIVLSALNAVLGFVLRGVVVKFVIFTLLFAVVSGFVTVLQAAGVFPSAAGLTGAFGGIPAGMWYFLDLFRFDVGIPMVLSAYGARFIIRRIPFIG